MSWQTQAAGSAEPAGGGEALRSIAEVQRETGLSARTLRYYEELGLLPGVRRRAGGRRVYDPDAIERVRFIQRLKKLGLSLSEIKELNAVYGLAGSTHAMLERLAELLDRHRRDVEERLTELALLRGEIDRYRSRVEQRIRTRARASGGSA